MENYRRKLHTVYKALERPALCFGLPMELLFVVCAVPFLLGMFISLLFWLSIPVIVFFLGLLSKNDPHIYNLLYLKFKTLGNRKANLYYGANTIFSGRYEPIKIFVLKKRDDKVR